jgi:hypothetical protein
MSRVATVLLVVVALVATPVAAATGHGPVGGPVATGEDGVGNDAAWGERTTPPGPIPLVSEPAGEEVSGGATVERRDLNAGATPLTVESDPRSDNRSDRRAGGYPSGLAPRPPDPPVPDDGVATQAPSDPVNVTWRYALTPNRTGEIELEITYEIPDGRDRFVEYVGDRETVVSRTGFEPPNTSANYMEWNGRQNSTGADARAVFALDVNTTGLGGTETVDPGPWALAHAHFTGYYQDRAYGPVTLTVANESREGERVTYGGTVESNYLGYVFIGDQTVYTRRANGQTIRLVQPAAANATPTPERALSVLARTAGTLRVDARDERVTAFVGPDPVRGGGAAGDAAFWVGDDEPARNAEPTLVHEYVHTRQIRDYRANETDSLGWFTEGSASLFEALYARQFNYSSFADFRASAFDVPSRVVLANVSTYEADDDRLAPGYDEGMAVLGGLDYRIRVATDGEKSLVDVFRRVNDVAATRTATAGDLQSIAESVAGRSFETFFDRYVRARAIPDPPADPSVYPGETVPVTGSIAPTESASGLAAGRVYAVTDDEAFVTPDRPPVTWGRDVYGSAPVESGAWSLPVDPNRTETQPGSSETTWNYTFAYVQPPTTATARDGVPDVYPIAGSVPVSEPTAVDGVQLPRAHRLNVSVATPDGTPGDGTVSLGIESFNSPVQVEGQVGPDGRAFAATGPPGLDVAGPTSVVLSTARGSVQVRLPPVERATRLRYVDGADGPVVGYAVPDEPVTAGEPATVYAMVDTTTVSGSETVSVTVDGRPVANASVASGTDDSVLVPLRVTLTDPGRRSLSVGDRSAGTVRVRPDAAPLPTTLAAPDRIEAGQPATIEATVSPPDLAGTVDGETTVALSVNGTRVANRTAAVRDGESATVGFDRTFEAAGERALTVETNVTLNGTRYRGTNATTLPVVRPPNLTAAVASTNAPLQPGETLTLTATLANPGSQTAEETVRLRVGGTVRDAPSVTVPGGETRTLTLRWETTAADAGRYTATVATANDTASRPIRVGRTDFAVAGLATDGPVEVDGYVTVDVEVRNDGSLDGDAPVAVSLGGQQVETATVAVPAGETTPVEVPVDTGERPPGTYTARVAVANDSRSTTVEIRERTVEPVATAAESPTDPDDDGEYEDVDGDGRASFRDVVVLFEHLDDSAVRSDPGAFDFDGDGTVSFADVVGLFRGV